MKKVKNKTTQNNMINYGIVILLFVIVQVLSSTGNLSRLLTGLLVPICVYTIAAVSHLAAKTGQCIRQKHESRNGYYNRNCYCNI